MSKFDNDSSADAILNNTKTSQQLSFIHSNYETISATLTKLEK